jgi:hypothetical protein
LWLGSEASQRGDHQLIRRLIERVCACALCRPLLFCVDGLAAYVTQIRRVFHQPTPSRGPGRPRLRPWDQLAIAQVVEPYTQKHVVGIAQRIVQGSPEQVQRWLLSTKNEGPINTAYIERLNATFRACQAALVRRGRALARPMTTLEARMYWMGTGYNS